MDFRGTFARLAQKDDRLSWVQHVALVRAFYKRKREIMQWPVLPETNGAVTAYVANFKRPQNIAPIVHALLSSPSINRVIVSNNNPACDLNHWFHASSNRVTVVNHEESQSAFERFEHVRTYPSSAYLIIDDDLLLLPSQIEHLLAELQKHPEMPHGLYGQEWQGEHFRGGIQNAERSIDVISRIYTCTDSHLAEFFRLASLVGVPEDHPDRKLSRIDDLLVSFSGSVKPRIHDAGALVDCPSQGTKGIATWREEGFHVAREEMYQKLLNIKPLL